jgi:putative peptidoglycan lipid II flippase
VKDISIARGTIAEHKLSPVRILIAAAIFHLAVTTTIYALGRYALIPGTFDQHGTAVSFAYDGIQNCADAAELSGALVRGELLDWLMGPYPLHVKLYSICFVLFGPWLGFNIIGAEPLNALFYLATLALVFQLGRETFTRRSGLLAAGMVALWPSFLIHTTQLLRDPLLIVALLAFILIVIKTLAQRCSWRRCLICIVGAALAAIAIWVVRMSAWEVVKVVTYLSLPYLLIRARRDKRLWLPNLVAVAMLMMIISIVPQLKGFFRSQQFSVKAGPNQIAEQVQGLPLWAKIAQRRHFFATEPSWDGSPIGSNIDTDIEFDSWTDIAWYTPRAMMIGLWAPFPDMWVGGGKHVGSAGRFLSGAEMLVTYFIELLALAALWMKRKYLITWFLFPVLTTGVIGLALILVNIGTLYRQRYPFWVLLVVMGAGGAVFPRIFSWRERKMGESAAVV